MIKFLGSLVTTLRGLLKLTGFIFHPHLRIAEINQRLADLMSWVFVPIVALGFPLKY